jgi:hypothetical protein
MVRIHLPPADSLSLGRIRFRRSGTPAFRAGVRGWLGDWVGRDAQVVSIPQQPAAISLSRHFQYRSAADGVGGNAPMVPTKPEPSPGLIVL